MKYTLKIFVQLKNSHEMSELCDKQRLVILGIRRVASYNQVLGKWFTKNKSDNIKIHFIMVLKIVTSI